MNTEKIKVGILSPFTLSDSTAMSGTPSSVYHALKKLGFTLIDLSPDAPVFKNHWFFMRIFWRAKRTFDHVKSQFSSSEQEYLNMINRAEKSSAAAQKK